MLFRKGKLQANPDAYGYRWIELSYWLRTLAAKATSNSVRLNQF
jgi:hypothetical protein